LINISDNKNDSGDKDMYTREVIIYSYLGVIHIILLLMFYKWLREVRCNEKQVSVYTEANKAVTDEDGLYC